MADLHSYDPRSSLPTTFTDVTSQWKEGVAALPKGSFLMADDAQLHDTLNAVELCNPKMDMHMHGIGFSEPPVNKLIGSLEALVPGPGQVSRVVDAMLRAYVRAADVPCVRAPGHATCARV